MINYFPDNHTPSENCQHLGEKTSPDRKTGGLGATMNNKKQALALLVVFVLGLVVAFSLGFLTHDVFFSTPSFPLVDEAYSILENHAYRSLPESPTIEYGMIRGMISALGDPYTHFVEPVAHVLQSNELRGEFGGIGANIEWNLQGDFLLYPFEGGPAAQAGVQTGDLLLAVEALVVTPQTELNTIQAALSGTAGQPVHITILRQPTGQQQNFSIVRASYPLPSITYLLDPDEPRLGVVKINLMSAMTDEELQNAFQTLQQLGATHFVLDLRDNRGGLLDTGVDLARLFLQGGAVVLQQQYKSRSVESFWVQQNGPLFDLPLAVLINGNTASAAEIFAGAMKANERALLVGQPSFGKSTLQLVFELSDKSSIHVTAAEWWIPGLEPPVSEGGIQPDILITDDPTQPRPEMRVIMQHWFANP
jgi:carboxyl-terminal processing protease